MGIYRKISFLSIKAEISTLDDFLALFMNRRIIFSQKMEKHFFVGNTQRHFLREALLMLSERETLESLNHFVKQEADRTTFYQVI